MNTDAGPQTLQDAIKFFADAERAHQMVVEARWPHGGVGKEIVMGILERGKEKGRSRIRAKVIPDTTRQTLHGEVKAHVTPGAEVFTDAHQGYRGLSADLEHAWVDHAVKYVEGKVH